MRRKWPALSLALKIIGWPWSVLVGLSLVVLVVGSAFQEDSDGAPPETVFVAVVMLAIGISILSLGYSLGRQLVCPHCARSVPGGATVCGRCGRELAVATG